MENKPGEMLPKVLETAMLLYRSSPSVELGRLCSGLFLDVLTNEAVPASEKPFICSQHMSSLWQICQTSTDYSTYRDAVLTFGRTYDWMFDLVAKTSNKQLWDVVCQFKEFILSKWKTPYPLEPSEDPLKDHSRALGVKLATVKFISKAVIVQTSGTAGVNITLVPDNHPVITGKSNLESEAKKLLDLLLNFLSEEPMMVPALFSGILNCLSFVMKQRPQATNRILGGLLRFNVDLKYQQDSDSVLQYRLGKRFVERSYKIFVQFGLRSQLIKNSGSMAAYHAKLSKISQTLHIIGEEVKAKGIMNFDPKQIERKMPPRDRAKYIKALRPSVSQNNQDRSPAPLPSQGSPDVQLLTELQKYTMSKSTTSNFFNTSPVAFDNSYASVYSLMNSKHSEIDISKLSQGPMVKLCTESLYQTDTNKVIAGLSIIASRYTDLMNKYTQQNETKKRPREDESTVADTKRQAIKEDDDEDDIFEDDDKQEFSLGAPKPMTEGEKKQHIERIISHIISVKDSDEIPSVTAVGSRDVWHKVRLLDWDNKTSWLTLLIRLTTRGLSHNEEMSNLARQAIYDYFLEDFSNRIAVVIEWLSEEWYYETLQGNEATPTYNTWSLKVLDALVPFLENSHRRLFIRLVSELPHLSETHIHKIGSLCLDPLRSSLGFQSLKFMTMFRPPVKPFVQNLLQSMQEKDETVKEQCQSILSKFF